jgi:ribosomal protein S18 acetylase RimI-like enzyme
MELVMHEVIDGDLVDPLYELYERAFDPLRWAAAAPHTMSREHFAQLLADKRVVKHVVFDTQRDNRPCGIATLTNDLSSYEYVSPEYFAHRWPEEFAQGRVWYVAFLAVDPDYQGTGTVAHLVGSICQVVSETGGVVGLDVCGYNEQAIRLPAALLRLGRTFSPGVTHQRVDTQSYWAYEFPTPA